MTERSVKHATFSHTRSYDASPERVFNAFADIDAKKKWFGGPPEWDEQPGEFDFRIGGIETSIGGPKGGFVSRFYCTYYDIVPNERIVYCYEMYFNDDRTSVSVATIEFEPEGAGTKLTMTEMGAFLDEFDHAEGRSEGTAQLLDALGKSLVDG